MTSIANLAPASDGPLSGVIEPEFTWGDAHAFRSKFVEKCAEAERHVLTLLNIRGRKPNSRATLSAKIETLKLALNRQVPLNRHDLKTLALLEEFRPIADLRSELVHSTMSIGILEGRQILALANAGETHDTIDRRVIVSTSDMKCIRLKLSNIVNQLKQLAECASSAATPS